MCGIVAASSHRNITDLLISGLQTLEYRGYDSAGIALQYDGEVRRERIQGKVSALQARLAEHLPETQAPFSKVHNGRPQNGYFAELYEKSGAKARK